MDEHEGVVGFWAAVGGVSDVPAGVVAFGVIVVADGVVDAVDFFRLGITGIGGKGEVGIAAGFFEDFDFIVDATPAAIGAGVVEGPVAVDEGVLGLAGLFIAWEEAVAVFEDIDVLQKAFAEGVGGVVVVVVVDFDFAEALAAEGGDKVKMFRLVFVNWKKEGVARRKTIDILELRIDFRVEIMPSLGSG